MDVCDLWIVSTLQSLINDQQLWTIEKNNQEKKSVWNKQKKKIEENNWLKIKPEREKKIYQRKGIEIKYNCVLCSMCTSENTTRNMGLPRNWIIFALIFIWINNAGKCSAFDS